MCRCCCWWVCAGTASGWRTCPALSPTTVARGGWSRTPRTGSPAPAPPSRAPSASWLSSQAPTSVRPAGRGHRSETGDWRVIGFEVASLLRLGTTHRFLIGCQYWFLCLNTRVAQHSSFIKSNVLIAIWSTKIQNKYTCQFASFTGDSSFFLQMICSILGTDVACSNYLSIFAHVRQMISVLQQLRFPYYMFIFEMEKLINYWIFDGMTVFFWCYSYLEVWYSAQS